MLRRIAPTIDDVEGYRRRFLHPSNETQIVAGGFAPTPIDRRSSTPSTPERPGKSASIARPLEHASAIVRTRKP